MNAVSRPPPGSAAAAPGSARATGWQRWLGASISRRLTLGLVFALLVSSAMLMMLALIANQQTTQHEQEQSAQRMARLFEAALHNAMLKRDLSGLQDILAGFGQVPGVAQVRLLEPHGTVRFASHPQALGTQASGPIDGMCLTVNCPPPTPRLQWHLTPDGEQLSIAYPIFNEPRCIQCHGSSAAKPVNGVLLVDFQPLAANTPVRNEAWLLGAVGLGALGLFALIMTATLRRHIIAPLAELAQTTDRLAAGELHARVGWSSGDELGRVARGFDHMAERIDQVVRQLRTQGEFLQALIDAMPDPVLVIGPDFRIQLANQAYATLLGTDRQSVVGQCCHQTSRGLAQPCASTLVTCPVAEMQHTPRSVRSVMALTRADGSEVNVDIESAPVTDATGQSLTIEVLRPLDRTLQFSQEQRLSTIGLLANGVAHEIHNPLASIRLALQASLRGLQSGDMARDELTDYLKLVDHEIDRCVLATQRLMQMSRAPNTTLQPVPLAPAIDDVLALLREDCRAAGAQVQAQSLPENLCVWGDGAELRQVLVNLVHNALHAMPDGGQISIECDAPPSSEMVRLRVRDTGCGIAAQDLPRIFMPFFSQRADGQRGMGLGLAISKTTMERFGGAIEATSIAGQGSTFTLTLRRATSTAGPDNDGHAHPDPT